MVRDPGNPGQRLIPGPVILGVLVIVIGLALALNMCGKG